MKKYILSILICIFFFNCKAQTTVNINTFNQEDNSNKYFKDLNNYRQNFVGIWENTTDTTTFRLILFLNNEKPMGSPIDYYKDFIGGKFQIIENAGTSQEIIIHDSVKTFPNGITTSDVFLGNAGPTGLAGYFDDTCASGGEDVQSGFFSLDIININSIPLQAHWKIKKAGLILGRYYSMPKDVIMTKVN